MKGRALAAGSVLLAGLAVMVPPQQGGNDTPSGDGAGAGVCAPGPGVQLAAGAVTAPMRGRYAMTSEYGMRYFRGAEMHDGLDFAAPGSPPVLAVAAGTVTFAGYAGGAGNMVQIDHGGGVVTQSMHLASLSVAQGDAVSAGQELGPQGSTGDSTGPHLHLRVRVGGVSTDPRVWLAGMGVALPAPGGWSAGDDTPPVPGPAGNPRAGCAPATGGTGGADMEKIGAEYRDWLVKAAATCDAVTVPLLAAQIEAESRWNRHATSPAGARGLSQFMPATWAAYGRDDDGNGRVDPTDVGDAIMAQARYDCSVARLVAGVPGDVQDLMLAGYNAGPGAVLAYGGVPPFAETQGYVAKIRAGMDKYTR